MTSIQTKNCLGHVQTHQTNLADLAQTKPFRAPEFLKAITELNKQSKTENWCQDYFVSQLQSMISEHPELASSLGLPKSSNELKQLVSSKQFDTNPLFNGEIIQQQDYPQIGHGSLEKINAIVLHRTNSSTAQSVKNAYANQKNGAHYLIDSDGTIYQTLGVDKMAWHVGKIRSKCAETKTCDETESSKLKTIKGFSVLHQHEVSKKYPERFPINSDSIGIEVVGMGDVENGYTQPTKEQLASTLRLVNGLQERYKLDNQDVFPHGQISYKDNPRSEGLFFGFDVYPPKNTSAKTVK